MFRLFSAAFSLLHTHTPLSLIFLPLFTPPPLHRLFLRSIARHFLFASVPKSGDRSSNLFWRLWAPGSRLFTGANIFNFRPSCNRWQVCNKRKMKDERMVTITHELKAAISYCIFCFWANKASAPFKTSATLCWRNRGWSKMEWSRMEWSGVEWSAVSEWKR